MCRYLDVARVTSNFNIKQTGLIPFQACGTAGYLNTGESFISKKKKTAMY